MLALDGKLVYLQFKIHNKWMKCREISGVLFNRRLSLKQRGVLYRTCIRTVMTYGCETWSMKKENEDFLTRAERRMIRMLCGVKLSDREESEVLQKRLGLIDDIATVTRKARLRWFGHVYRREPEEGIKKAFSIKVEGKTDRGRPRKTWYEVIKNDLREIRATEEDTLDRVKWRSIVRSVTANPRSRGKRQYNLE